MTDPQKEMARIRAAIEQADADLVAALDARARAIRDFLALRERDPQGYYVLPSSAEVIARARELRRDFPEVGIEPVLRQVLGTCAAMVAPVQVAVLGPEDGFAHLAARRWFGAAAHLRLFGTVREVFDDLERGRATYAVVPFETSSEGALSATLTALAETSFQVIGELTIAHHYHLYSRTGNPADLEKIFGTASGMAACERTLRREFPGATLLDVRSSIVAWQLALEDHGAAALGSEILAELGEGTDRSLASSETLRVLRKNVEDEAHVHTRFFVLGSQQPRRTGNDRAMLLLGLGGEPGSLYAALEPFAKRGINLTRIESRPARGVAWQHLFFLELDGHVSDRTVLTAIDEVKARARYLKVLGSYPRPG